MPLPIGPVLGVVARAVATKAAQRGATAAVSRGAISSSQFARGAAGLAKFGKTATTLGRGAMLMSAFMGNAAGGTGMQTAPSAQPTEPVKKQGLDTYSDNLY